ncbi:neuronal PAS domain-containing protein 3 isoform X3 [Tachysurus ichikawai]
MSSALLPSPEPCHLPPCPSHPSLHSQMHSYVCFWSFTIGSQRRRSPSAVASEIFEPHLGSHILQVGSSLEFTSSVHCT